MVILTILGPLLGIQVNPVSRLFFFKHRLFLFVSASTHPEISDEQKEFIRRVLDIPLEQRKCRDLITLDTLYLYCGGPEPTAEARKLDEFSHRHK